MTHYESYGKTDHKRNITSENITYLVDNKNLCQHTKFHLLTARRRKCISETMYRYTEEPFNTTHINISLQREETIYQLRNGLIVRLNMICIVAQIALNHYVYKLNRK